MPTGRSNADVLIIGGGVIGLTTAYTLARDGAKVTLLDRHDFGRESSWAGAGIISPGNPERAATPYDRLRAISSVAYPSLAAELRERTGIDPGYRCTGGLEFNDADAPVDPDEWTNEGIAWERHAAEQVPSVEPAVGRDVGPAYYLPGMAQVRNPRLVKALATSLRAQGVTLVPGSPVYAWETDGSRIAAAVTHAGRQVARHYLLCTGAWCDELLRPFGLRTEVRPVRGQIALLNTRAPGPSKVLIRGKRYVVPRGDGRVLVGSTEEDAGFDKRTTAEAIQGLLEFGTALVPSLADAAVEQCWAGLRPGSPDGLPFIGAAPGVENLWVAAGHFRSGIQLAPGTARVLSESIQRRPTAVPLEMFRLDRR
jgi:glycine oxidase